MTLKCGKLTLSKQTVRSLHTRSSIRAGVVDPFGGRSGPDKCREPPGDDPPPADGVLGGAKRVPIDDTISVGMHSGKLPI